MIPAIRRFLGLEHIRHFMTLFSSSVIGQGLSLALSPLLSRLFTPEDFGLVALYLGIISVMSVITTGKYEQAIMLPREDKAAVHLFRLVLVVALVISLITAILSVTLNQFITGLLGNPDISPWLYAIPVSLMLHAMIHAATFYSNRTKKFSRIAQTTLTQNISLNGVRVLTGWFQTPANGLVLGQLAGHFAAMGSIFWKTLKQIRRLHVPFSFSALKKQAAVYSQYPRFNMPVSLTNNLSGSLPIFLFTWGFSAEIAGLYAFGYTFVFRPVSLFSQSTQQVLSQKMIENHHHGKSIYPSLKKMVQRFFLAGIIPLIIFAIWAPDLFAFVFSENYETSGKYLQILSPWLFMVFLTSPLTFIHELFFRQKKAMVIDIIYLILRFFALMTGIWLQDVMIALTLFSAVSTLTIGYKLFWYMQLARNRQHTNPTQTAP